MLIEPDYAYYRYNDVETVDSVIYDTSTIVAGRVAHRRGEESVAWWPGYDDIRVYLRGRIYAVRSVTHYARHVKVEYICL